MRTIEKIIQSATPPVRSDVLWLDISDVNEPQLRFYVNGKWEIASSEAEEVQAIIDSIGQANGIASLNDAGLVPSSQLPSYVDDVIEVADYEHLPTTGESGKIYVTIDNGNTYRWSGSMYVQINKDVVANLPFPDGWHKNDTMAQLISDINSDTTAITGKMYVSTVGISDLPASLLQAEMQVSIMASGSNGKIILFTITSNDVHPYHWEYISVDGVSGSWRSFLDASDISSKADKVSSPTAGNFAGIDSSGNITDSGKKASDFISEPAIAGTDGQILSSQGGSSVWVDAPQGTVIIDSAMSDTSEHTVQNKVIKAYADENFAKKDGYYESMTVGLAENLLDTKGTGSEQSFVKRTSCGDVSITDDGSAIVQKFLGTTVKFNQLVPNDAIATQLVYGVTITNNNDGSYTLDGSRIDSAARYSTSYAINVPVGHILAIKGYYCQLVEKTSGSPIFSIFDNEWYLVTLNEEAKLRFRISEGASFNNFKVYPQVIDLTQIFGAGNEPSTVAEFEAWLANNIGIHPYYGYTGENGILIPNKATGVRTIGYNRYNPSTGQAELVKYDNTNNTPSEMYQIFGAYTATNNKLTFNGASGQTYEITIGTNGRFDIPEDGTLVVPGGNATTTCVHLRWSGYRDPQDVTDTDECAEYWEAYWEETRSKDLTAITGKLNGAGSSVVIFPDGLKQAGSVRDEIQGNKAIKRVGSVDLGTLGYSFRDDAFIPNLSIQIPDIKGTPNNNIAFNALCSRFIVKSAVAGDQYSGTGPIVFCVGRDYIFFKNTGAVSAQEFKTKMSGVKLYYELETPLEYTLDEEFNTSYRVADFGTEEEVPQALDSNNLPQTGLFAAIIKYNNDFTRELVNLPKNYVPRSELEPILDVKANVDGNYPSMTVGAAESLAGKDVVGAEYTFRKSGGNVVPGTGAALIPEIQGKSVVWNQLVKDYTQSANIRATGSSTIKYEDGKIKISIVGTGSSNAVCIATGQFVAGHKIACLIEYTGTRPTNTKFGSWISVGEAGTTVGAISSTIFSMLTTSNESSGLWLWGETIDFEISSLILVDLTLMFGAGNEPSTVEEFEALYPLPYYKTNTGEIVNNKATAIETVGFNQWDEQWEYGFLNLSTGVVTKFPEGDNHRIVSKNLIPVFPNTNYYCYFGMVAASGDAIYIVQYDADGNFVSGDNIQRQNSVFTTGANTRYIRFMNYKDTISYQNDICINFSDASKNGTYEAYWKNTLNLNIPTLTGKLNGEGSSVTIFADGMKSAGTVHDSLTSTKAVKRVGKVDLGSLTWGILPISEEKHRFYSTSDVLVPGLANTPNLLCSKFSHGTTGTGTNNNTIQVDGNTGRLLVYSSNYEGLTGAEFKVAMSGVYLYYELATPEEYTLDQTLNLGYKVDTLGTEKRLPEDTDEVIGAPIVYRVQYAMDAVGTINGLPQNYIGKNSMDAILTALQTAGIIASYTLTYDSTTQKYNCSITAPSPSE